MDLKIKKQIPTVRELEKYHQEIEAIAKKIARFAVNLSPDDRRRTVKFLRGGEKIVGVVGKIADSQGYTIPRISTEVMKRDLELAERLQPLADALEALSQTIKDTMLEARSESWWMTTAFYDGLVRLSGADPKLAKQLVPVIEFFKHGPRAPKQAPAPPATEVGHVHP